MKPNQTNEGREKTTGGTTFKDTCVACGKKIVARIARAKAAIFAESRRALETQDRLLQLALNEAEALAWQTNYPHLVFPTLATEKVQAVAAWNSRQQSVRRTSRIAALAA